MQMGRMDEASKDLDELAQKRPDYFGLPAARIYYYRIKGDQPKELEEMKKLVADRLARYTADAASSASVRWNKAWIAELSGKYGISKEGMANGGRSVTAPTAGLQHDGPSSILPAAG